VVSLDRWDVIDKVVIGVKSGGEGFGREMIALRVVVLSNFLVLSTEVVKVGGRSLVAGTGDIEES
jgi:hypothetical protein